MSKQSKRLVKYIFKTKNLTRPSLNNKIEFAFPSYDGFFDSYFFM